jgi:hypothetical protein
MWLEKAFEESEVVEAVRALNGDQTLMVSQWHFFFFFFFRLFGRKVLKVDIMNAFHEFHLL